MKHLFNFLHRVTLFFLLFFSPSLLLASENETTHNAEKKFNAGEMIMEHIIDAHEWHMMEVGETAIVLPLPIILFDEGKIVTFCSSKFHHGKDAYKGYKLETEGAYKGKIVKVDENGQHIQNAKLPLDLSITKNTLSLFISLTLLCIIFLYVAKCYKRNPKEAPKGFQNMIEYLILFIRNDVVKPSIGKKYEKYLPFLLTLFFFIFFSNLLGIVPFFPGGVNLTGNIAITMVWHYLRL